MASGAPAVSVLMAVHNRFEYVGAALASVCRQSVQDLEVIVADSSTLDGVGAHLQDLAARDRRIRVVTSPVPLSAPEARNLALGEARAPVVALLDSDDLMLPGRLATQLAELSADPSVVLVGSAVREIDPWGLPVPARPSIRRPPRHDLTVRWLLPFECPILGPTCMIRADALRAVGGFDVTRPLCDDWSALWQLSERGRIRRLPEQLTAYRRHPRQSGEIHRRRAVVEAHLLSLCIIRSRLGLWIGPPVPGMAPELTWRPAGREEVLAALLDQALREWSPTREERAELEDACRRRLAEDSRDSAPWLAEVLTPGVPPAEWSPGGPRAT